MCASTKKSWGTSANKEQGRQLVSRKEGEQEVGELLQKPLFVELQPVNFTASFSCSLFSNSFNQVSFENAVECVLTIVVHFYMYVGSIKWTALEKIFCYYCFLILKLKIS